MTHRQATHTHINCCAPLGDITHNAGIKDGWENRFYCKKTKTLREKISGKNCPFEVG